MLSFFKRNTQQIEPPTYNERVRNFWAWFQEVAPDFSSTIKNGKCTSLTDQTSAKVKELFPGFGWVYGPGENRMGHSLTITGEGVEHLQLLTLHWLELAPSIEGWTFYAARQPGPIKGHVIHMGALKFDPKEIWVTPVIDEENECLELTIWHPKWPELEKGQRWTITFLYLDEALGEYGTQSQLGELRLESDRLADSFPLEELPDFVAETASRLGWKKFHPGQTYMLFTIEPSDKTFRRSDLRTLNTIAPNLFRDYLQSDGELRDPFSDCGADYIYLSIPESHFTKGSEIEIRSGLEDAIEKALKSQNSGRCLGGGFGLDYSYIDLLIFDGSRSIEIIKKALEPFPLPEGSSLEYFAPEKRDKRLQL